MQNEGGSTDVETNVKEIRTKMAAIATDGGVTISEDLTLTGIVVSDVEAGGFAGNRNCVVVDNSTEAGAGIIVRFPASGYKFPVGQVITGSIKGAKAALSMACSRSTSTARPYRSRRRRFYGRRSAYPGSRSRSGYL